LLLNLLLAFQSISPWNPLLSP